MNFDTLIERSLYKVLPCDVFCPLVEKASKQTDKGKYTIIKPHGSFPLPWSAEKSHVGLTTTLSEIKDKPNFRTQQVFTELFKETSSIVFVGYAGEDWDILPIFYSLFNKIEHVYWINHHTMADGIMARGENDPSIAVQQFLSKMGENAHIIHRNTKEVLHDIAMMIGIPINNKTITEIEKRKAPKVEISNQLFVKDLQSKYAVLVGISTLLENGHMEIIGEILSFLDKEFGKNEIKKNLYLCQAFYNYAGWYYFVRKEFKYSFNYKHKALKINKNTSHQSYTKEYINTLLSIGYEYISYAKPQCLITPIRFIKTPYYFVLGYHYLSVSGKITQDNSVKAAAEYYKTDFFHNWAYVFMIFNTKVFSFLRSRSFSKILSKYERIYQIDSEYMSREYFYLRMIEARILAGKPLSNKDEVERNVLNITNYFLRTKQFGHLRNVLITRAFIAYDCNNPLQKEKAKQYYEMAKLDKNNIKNVLVKEIQKDPCINAIYDFVNSSSDKRTLTKSAIMRYEIFGGFFL